MVAVICVWWGGLIGVARRISVPRLLLKLYWRRHHQVDGDWVLGEGKKAGTSFPLHALSSSNTSSTAASAMMIEDCRFMALSSRRRSFSGDLLLPGRVSIDCLLFTWDNCVMTRVWEAAPLFDLLMPSLSWWDPISPQQRFVFFFYIPLRFVQLCEGVWRRFNWLRLTKVLIIKIKHVCHQYYRSAFILHVQCSLQVFRRIVQI